MKEEGDVRSIATTLTRRLNMITVDPKSIVIMVVELVTTAVVT